MHQKSPHCTKHINTPNIGLHQKSAYCNNKNILFCQNSLQFMNTTVLHACSPFLFLPAWKQEAGLSLKLSEKVKRRAPSTLESLKLSEQAATAHWEKHFSAWLCSAQCALWLCTLHLSTSSLCTLPSTTVLMVAVGKTNALHLVDCTSMDVDCSKEEEAVKKAKNASSTCNCCWFFLRTLEFTSSAADWQQKRGQAPTTGNNNIVCHDNSPWRKKRYF